MNKVAIRLGSSIILGIFFGLLINFLTGDIDFGLAIALLSGLIVGTSPDWRDL